MSIPVWEVLEGHANTVEGQEHKPYNELVNLSGQPLDLVGEGFFSDEIQASSMDELA